jgi:hypothetical protein
MDWSSWETRLQSEQRQMEAPLRLRLVVLSALWLAVVGVISAQEGEPWQGNRTRAQETRLIKEHVMSRWENISVIQINYQLFMQFENGRRVHLYTDDKARCFLRAALLSPSRVFIEGCSRTFVADLSGVVQYELHSFVFFDVVPNLMGTRFAVFERGRSTWHDFANGSYNKLRLLVYSTEGGRKLYTRKWSQAPGEQVVEARISLSDDGSTLYLHQNRTTTFSIPAGRSH